MINSSEVRDARINLDGDKVACQKWLPFAYSKLAVQWDKFKKTKAVSSKSFKPDNQTTIICAVKPGGNKWIYIKSGSPDLSINGIIRSSYIDYSSSSLHEYMDKNTPFPKKWIKTPKLAIKPSDYFGFTNTGNLSQHAYIKASMYSGVMRKYMQIVLGTKIEHKFDYRWEKTHAFQFTTVPTTINGKVDFDFFKERHQFWLVEIGRNGCYIARANIYIPKFKNNSDLDSFPFIPQTYEFPTGDALSQAITDKNAFLIYSAAEMADFYQDSSPFFKECGWSSLSSSVDAYTGNTSGQYTNTCYRLVNGVLTSQVWTIGITINGFPNGSNVFVSKYKQLVDSGRMWSSSNNTGINVPDYENNCIKTLSFNSFDKPVNGIFNFPWYATNDGIIYSKSARINFNIPTSQFQSGDGEAVNLSYRTSLMSKLPVLINNGLVFVEDYKGTQASGISPFIINYIEKGYVVPMYDREAIFTNTYSKRRAYYYNSNTGQVTEAADPVMIDPVNNTGNLGNLYYDENFVKLKKNGMFANDFLPIVISESALNNAAVNDIYRQDNSLHIELVSNVFVVPYTDFTYATPYMSLYRVNINNTIYSYLNNYVNYSATINERQGTNGVYVNTFPVYGGDEITNFSFVGKP